MSKSIFCSVAAILFSLAAYSQYWQQLVNFTIDVTLNDNDHSLDGFEKITYVNNSPDTLSFIWIHLWPNAFKNDKTAFSEQLLINNRTDFYFSNKEQRGYINRLDFKVDGITAQITDHPQYIDIIRLELPKPLAPGGQALIATPFYVQLPENFSRGGYHGDAYQVTQWFPKPAVYDRKGWHPIPYLDQGEFYSEFGNFDVRITAPANYVIAATGELQNDEEKEWLKKRAKFTWEAITSKKIVKKGSYKQVKKTVQLYPASSNQTKTLQFIQNNVVDFAWFADKRFIVNQDTLQLRSGRMVTAYSYYLPGSTTWKNSIAFIKKTIRFRSAVMGEYPFNTVSAVEAKMGFEGGMEYPTITSISPMSTSSELEGAIEHEVGHNWLQGILASNERQYPWMDEGMNTYYDHRYKAEKKTADADAKKMSLGERLNNNFEPVLLQSLVAVKKDQPINTPAENFTEINNGMIAYYKTGKWMKLLENYLGKNVFDSSMKTYYRNWQFKHPYPEDFKQVAEQVSGKKLDTIFNLLDEKGALPPLTKRKIQPALGLFHFANTDKFNYINIFPAIGFNQYDKFMAGLLVHNYNLPPERFQFLLAPLYGAGSKTLAGIGRVSYTTYPSSAALYKVVYSLSAEKFSTRTRLDTFNNKVFENFSKIVPGVRVYFNHPALSKVRSSVDLRGFFINEKVFDQYAQKSGDSVNNYPVGYTNGSRWLTQLSFDYRNNRALYPYQYQLQWQQGQHFYRLNFNGNYFFNYAKGGGLNIRVFAAKFGYVGGRNSDASMYQPKLLGVRGDEDYTYSNYFIGRSASIANGDGLIANKGLAAQQIMIRDGGLKLVLDLYDHVQGRSENWVSAVNFTSTLPSSIFPENLPLRLFFDIGTYAEGWRSDPPTSRFLYTGGVQLSLFKNVLNVYLPLLYSSDFKDVLKATYPTNRLLKSISFSLDIQNFNLGKLNKALDF